MRVVRPRGCERDLRHFLFATCLTSGLAGHRREHSCTNIAWSSRLHGLLQGATKRTIESQSFTTDFTRCDVAFHFERLDGIELTIEVRPEQQSHRFAGAIHS